MLTTLATDTYLAASDLFGSPTQDVPDGPAEAPGDLGDRFDTLVGAAKWVGVAICVLALIGAFVSMAMRFSDGRMGGGEGIGGIAKVLLAVVGISAAPTLIAFFI